MEMVSRALNEAREKMNRLVDDQIIMLVYCGYRGCITIETYLEADGATANLKAAVYMGEMLGKPRHGREYRAAVVDDAMAAEIEAMARRLGTWPSPPPPSADKR